MVQTLPATKRWWPVPPWLVELGRNSTPASALSWGAVALAVVIYLGHYLGGRSLWLDEAMIALNVKYLWPDELAGRLEYHQVAPIGWLYLQKLAYTLTGNLEFGLRATSVAAAVAALVLFRNLSFKMLGGLGALAATVTFAMAPSLARYAAEAKPYIYDVLFAVAALAAMAPLLAEKALDRGRLALLALVGVAAVLFSFAAVYVLAAAGGALIAHRFLAGDRKSALAVAVIAAGWLAVFAWVVLTIYNPQVAGSDLTEGGSQAFFNRTSFAPIPPTSIQDLAWYGAWLHRLVTFLFGDDARFFVVLIVGLGTIGLVTRSFWLTVMMLGPIAIGLVASSLKLYPLYDRLMLFLLPGLVFVMGAGIDWLVARSRGSITGAAVLIALFAATATPYLVDNLVGVRPPFAHQNVRPVLATLERKAAPGDLIYVANGATPAYLLYREEFAALGRRPWTGGLAIEQNWDCLIRDLDGKPTPRRAWFLLTTRDDRAPDLEPLQSLLQARDLRGQATLEASAESAWLVRLDLQGSGVTTPVAPLAPRDCGREGNKQKFDAPARLLARQTPAPHPG